MRIVTLEAENFKRLTAVEISPSGDIVKIEGKNGAGKSSVLDAIWVGLVGRSVAPPQPIRKGEQKCTIKLNLGDLIVTRTFTEKEGAPYTDTIKVTDPEGRSYPKPQTVLDELLGAIGFDPFAFVQMKPEAQASTLLGMVALPIDLDELADADAIDFETRRDTNRDVGSLKSRIDAISVPANLPEAVDRAALADQLAGAAETNGEIERERRSRQEKAETIEQRKAGAVRDREEATRLRARADELEAGAAQLEAGTAEREAELLALPPMAEPVDVSALRARLADADQATVILAAVAERARLVKEHDALKAKADGLTTAMAARETERRGALAKAKMPIEGLGFSIDGKKVSLLFGGVPFEQASTAEQLRASAAIAMAANPELRVLRIKDGSLLDDDSMAMLGDLAAAEDFQLWIERVGTGGVGIVIENGAVAASPADKLL